jgi:IS5 family transposase
MTLLGAVPAVDRRRGDVARVGDVNEAANLLHGEWEVVFADADYVGAGNREKIKDRPITKPVAMKRGKLKAMGGLARSLDRMCRGATGTAASSRRCSVPLHEEPDSPINQRFSRSKASTGLRKTCSSGSRACAWIAVTST